MAALGSHFIADPARLSVPLAVGGGAAVGVGVTATCCPLGIPLPRKVPREEPRSAATRTMENIFRVDFGMVIISEVMAFTSISFFAKVL